MSRFNIKAKEHFKAEHLIQLVYFDLFYLKGRPSEFCCCCLLFVCLFVC